MSDDSNRPNFVVIMSDQHNPHVMGCAGDEVVRTPNLDALAREGVRFEHAYCPYPLCVPARMGFLAARHPGEVDVWDNGNILDSATPTFAHALTDAGYETALCGRMHFLGPDQFHGFEKRLYGDCFHFLSKEVLGSGYHRTNGQTKYAVEVSGYGQAGYAEFDRRVTDRACAYLAERDDARPFCMVVGTILPHNPLICERDLFDDYMSRLPVPEPTREEDLAKLHPAVRAWRKRRGVDDLTPEQCHRSRAAYYALVTQMDRNIGRIVEAVQSSPRAEDTVIVYCSDHGDLAGEHGLWWKSNFYEGSVGVPLIASCPKRFAGGRTVDAVVNLIDVGPTLLDLAGAPPMKNASGLPRANVRGRSLAGFLADAPPADWSNETYAEYVGAHGDRPSCMVRSGPWKMMYYSEFDAFLLFNLEDDPGELHDRADDPACADVAARLLAKVRERFSPERMLEGAARQRDRWLAMTDHSSECDTPHPVRHETPPAEANAFDFTQLPGRAAEMTNDE